MHALGVEGPIGDDSSGGGPRVAVSGVRCLVGVGSSIISPKV